MKKDKSWLLEKHRECIQSPKTGEKMLDEGYELALNDMLIYINQLDEPETLSQEWIDENKVARINNLRKMTTSDVVPVEKLKNLLVPKQDKPESECEPCN